MAEDDEPQFIDAEVAYSAKEGYSEKDVVHRVLVAMVKICTSEFVPAWTEQRFYSVGGASSSSTIRHPDTRKAYINSVDFLHDLLLEEFDDEMKERDEEHEKELKELIKNTEDKKKLVNKELRLKRKLFQELTKFIARNGYFSAKSIEE